MEEQKVVCECEFCKPPPRGVFEVLLLLFSWFVVVPLMISSIMVYFVGGTDHLEKFLIFIGLVN